MRLSPLETSHHGRDQHSQYVVDSMVDQATPKDGVVLRQELTGVADICRSLSLLAQWPSNLGHHTQLCAKAFIHDTPGWAAWSSAGILDLP